MTHAPTQHAVQPPLNPFQIYPAGRSSHLQLREDAVDIPIAEVRLVLVRGQVHVHEQEDQAVDAQQRGLPALVVQDVAHTARHLARVQRLPVHMHTEALPAVPTHSHYT